MSYRGKYNGDPAMEGNYDRYMAHNEQSTIHKLKESYWTTKQYVKRKLGKKEDEHVVASDSELDAKLAVFAAIQKSSMDLLRCIEKYQDRLCALSQEENTMGRFLKTETQHDKTRAGKMMAAVGKSQSHASQQRLALRVPLVRLFQEVETFRYRAISDTLMTINRMEASRTEYRGALLWMKDASEELDPDTYKQLDKFRKVQAQVKKTKARFDKLKLDTMQKIDLLAASRCNMFSHVLANYQSTLLHFWEKTSRTHTAVAESFKGYQYFEFNLLKELAEPSKKLTGDSNQDVPERDTDSQGLYSDTEEEPGQEGERQTNERLKPLSERDTHDKADSEKPLVGLGLNSSDCLLGGFMDAPENTHSLSSSSKSSSQPPPPYSSVQSPCSKCQDLSSHQQQDHPFLTNTKESLHEPLLKLFGDEQEDNLPNMHHTCSHRNTEPNSSQTQRIEVVKQEELLDHALLDPQTNFVEEDLLIDFDGEKANGVDQQEQSGSMSNLFETDRKQAMDGEPTSFIDFGEEVEESIEEIKRKQDEEFDISGGLFKNKDQKQNNKEQKGNADLLTEEFGPDDTDKDDLSLLNEILNAPSTGEDDFSLEWQAVFGDSPLNPVATPTPAEPDKPKAGATFMPSNLLDLGGQMANMNINQGAAPAQMQPPQQMPHQQVPSMGRTMMNPPQQPHMGQVMPGGMALPGQLAPGANRSPNQKQQQQVPRPTKSKAQKADMSAWFNLFADLDPLSNPDAVGNERPEGMGGGAL